jgi:hypothetical protein
LGLPSPSAHRPCHPLAPLLLLLLVVVVLPVLLLLLWGCASFLSQLGVYHTWRELACCPSLWRLHHQRRWCACHYYCCQQQQQCLTWTAAC